MVLLFRCIGALAAAVILAVMPARAEFLNPDWSTLTIEGVAAPDWFAGVREGNYIGMCTACGGTMLLQVQVLSDDGTGSRIRSGQTTAASYTQIGQANAARLGKPAAYYGTEPIEFASAIGFVTNARAATGDFSVSYQLWSDGKQLVVKVIGDDQAEVAKLAKRTYNATAPLTFR